jgi:hypothetical protein
MALEVQTLEATDVDINTMRFNGELTNLSDYPLALCYFKYGVKSDLSDARKGDNCTLLNSLGEFSLVQASLEDDKNYYYKASVENYEAAKYQNEYMNKCGYKFTTTDADVILANPELFNKVLLEKTAMEKVFENGMVSRKFFSVSTNSPGAERFNNGFIQLYAIDRYDTEIAAINIDIDLTNATKLNIDWLNNGENNGCNDSIITINGSGKISKSQPFSRYIESIDVSSYTGICNIGIIAKDGDGNDPITSKINLYNLWLEE